MHQHAEPAWLRRDFTAMSIPYQSGAERLVVTTAVVDHAAEAKAANVRHAAADFAWGDGLKPRIENHWTGRACVPYGVSLQAGDRQCPPNPGSGHSCAFGNCCKLSSKLTLPHSHLKRYSYAMDRPDSCRRGPAGHQG